jgi:segregation and condensation protein A
MSDAPLEQNQQVEGIPAAAAEPAGEAPAGTLIIDEATDQELRLELEKFEGPLELLLHLIKVQEIDIFDIPIVKITDQYLRFLDLMREENLDVTGEFLVLAATLIQIKSRMLLPPDQAVEEDEEIEEEDPRLELVEKLLEYRRYREISHILETHETEEKERFVRRAKPERAAPAPDDEEEMLEVSLYDLIEAFRRVIRFLTDDLIHQVEGEGASVDEKIEQIEGVLATEEALLGSDLFKVCRSVVEGVCCFLAILELCRMGRIRVYQHDVLGDIRIVRAREDGVEPASITAAEPHQAGAGEEQASSSAPGEEGAPDAGAASEEPSAPLASEEEP